MLRLLCNFSVLSRRIFPIPSETCDNLLPSKASKYKFNENTSSGNPTKLLLLMYKYPKELAFLILGDILEILPNENIIPNEFKFFINDIEKLIYLSEDEWNEFIRKQRVLLKKYILNSENDFSNLVNLFLKKND